MTLTQASNTFKNVIRFGWLIMFLPLIVVIIYRIVISSGPTTPTDPTQLTFNAGFGKLPELVIETQDTQSSTPQFALDLVDAQFPANPGIAKVYAVISAPYGFLSQDRAKELGTKLNFSSDPTIIDNTIMEWSDRLRTLRMNISNLSFDYSFNYRLDPSVFGLNVFTSEQLAINQAIGILENLEIYDGSLGPTLASGEQTSQKLRYTGTEVVDSSTLFNTGAIRVDFFRPPIEQIPVVEPTYYQSNISITMSSKQNQPSINYFPRILDLQYAYWKHNATRFGTYPVINPSDAYEMFAQTPEDYLVFLGEESNPLLLYDEPVETYTVREVEFGYYNSKTPIQYLQPVWVFKGRARIESTTQAEFVAYVSAIRSDWLE
ncbi:hypothetical protein KC573_02775 [candidate division WWE3 bacterium]|uniref:Uncharacterized protein n=1 Tax=candidate division WWE3 bacterium TaxID=2053526 RepID=A0A955LWB9_UNCKA|nr:hypothetical protein [candidate division WWE3 bacterium]